MLTIVEKVMFLQNIDVFGEVSTEQLAYLAAVAEEWKFSAEEVIYQVGDASDSMFLVLTGRVRLHRGETDITVAGPEQAFGTWALFDDKPRVAQATVLDDSTVLRIAKDDFIDLLADHVQITQGVLKAIVRRLHLLLGRVDADLKGR